MFIATQRQLKSGCWRVTATKMIHNRVVTKGFYHDDEKQAIRLAKSWILDA